MTNSTTAEFVLGPLWGDREEVPVLPEGLPPPVLWKPDPKGGRAPYLRRHLDTRRDWIYIHEPSIPPA